MVVPWPGQRAAEAPSEDDLGPITQANLSAGTICTVLGILYLLAALALGGMAILSSCVVVSAKKQAELNAAVMLVGVVAMVSLVLAVFYFICGNGIKGGGKLSAWFVLVLTVLQLLGSLCSMGFQVLYMASTGGPPTAPAGAAAGAAAGASTGYWISFGMQVLVLVLNAKLFMCLISIVTRRQPRPTARPQHAWA
jgi:hypothetical protein